MKRFFGSIIDVRKGEVLLTVLMFSCYYLLLVTYYFLKPARDSMFLVKVSAAQLPVVFIITALVTMPVISLYNRFSRSMRLNKLITVTTVVIIINLIILRWLINIDSAWVYYLFYAWVSIYGALTTSQFWLLSNAVFTATQAKRIFVLLGLGGIIGAITGGEVTSLIVKYLNVNTPDLLFFCVGFLLITIVLVNAAWKLKKPIESSIRGRFVKTTEQRESLRKLFSTVFGSRHLTLIVGIVAMTMMVASFVDYQFKLVSSSAFPTTQELTSFLAVFYSRLSLVSLALQMFLAYRILRLIGVGGVILVLPIGLLLGSLSMFLFPGLLAAILLRGADGSLKYSLDKTARELLFLPVALDIKKRVKIFIDMFIDRWFRGLAGGLLLVCTMVLGLNIQQLSLVVLGLVGLWLGLALMMRREYVNAFRSALEKREIDPAELRHGISDAQTIKTLISLLESGRPRQVRYALDMLLSVKSKLLIDPAMKLLTHSDADIRRRAIGLLHEQDDPAALDDVQPLISDPDPDVRVVAISYLLRYHPTDSADVIQRLLNDNDPVTRAAAVACIAEHGSKEDRRHLTPELIDSILAVDSVDREACHILIARACGLCPLPDRHQILRQLMHDRNTAVVNAAIEGLGNMKDREYVPWLIDRLADRDHRVYARDALAKFGVGLIGTLSDYLNDAAIPSSIRMYIPRVLSALPHQESVDMLTRNLETVEPRLRFYLVKALNKLRAANADLVFDRTAVNSALLEETRSYFEIMLILQRQRRSDSPGGRLLIKALIEKQDQNLEHIFRLLGLSYPAQDIYFAYLGVTSNRKSLRANAVEFLDNLLHSDVRKYLIPILDEDASEIALRRGSEMFGIRFETEEEALLHLINGRDFWLKACAIYHAGGVKSERLREIILQARTDSDPVVRETANLIAAM